MDRQNIERLNELSRLARQRALTEEEAAERHERRQKYLEAFRKSLKAQLDNTVIRYEDGSEEPLRRNGDGK